MTTKFNKSLFIKDTIFPQISRSHKTISHLCHAPVTCFDYTLLDGHTMYFKELFLQHK